MNLNHILSLIIQPQKLNHWIQDFLIAIPRILSGFFLTTQFGAPKFGMPWTDPEKNLALFQVAEWFPEDVAKFGFPFALAPTFFAWMGAASEAIGGIFLMFGFGTRIAAFFMACTMMVAIFFQKWDSYLWEKLPAMGFLWVALFFVVLGSGKFGIDSLVGKRFEH